MFNRKTKYLFILISLIFTLTQLNSQSPTQFEKDKLFTLVPSTSRFVVNLSGKWECSFDDNEWFTSTVPYSGFDNKKIYFKRTVKIEKALNQKYSWQLYFLGIDDQVEIYINSQFVGKHLGGMTPFYVTIPNRLIYNDANTIKLVVTPAFDAAKKIREQNLYAKKNYTGIIRDLILIGTSKIWVSDVKYKYDIKPDNSLCILKAKVKISSNSISNYLIHTSQQDSLNALGLSKTSVAVEIALKNKQTNQIVAQNAPHILEIEPERTVPVEFTMGIANPLIWSVENPNLYEIYIKITKNGQLIDDYVVNAGFKTVYSKMINESGQIVVNGKPLEIKGVDYIEDYWQNAQTLSAYRMEQDIIQLKTLGANVVRFRYNAPHPYLVYLCDKYGIFSFIDLPVYDVPSSILSLDEIKVRMKNISDRYYVAFENSPSVFAWGVYEGVHEGSQAADEFSRMIVDIFRANSQKLIYKTILFGSKDINLNGYDFIGLSDTRKLKSSEELKNELYRLKGLLKSMPAFVHYGLAIQPDNHSGYSDPLSIESQAYYILNLYHIVKDKQFSGSIINSFNDYELSNPLLTLNNDDSYLCSSGIMDRARQQRLSYNMVQSLFNSEKEPLLNAGSFSEKTPVSYIVIGIVLLLIIIFLANRFKRFREYLLRSAFKPYNFYADIRDQRIISSIQTILLGLVIAITLGVYNSSILYYYKSSETAQLILTLFVPIQYIRELLFKVIWIPELLLVLTSLYFFALIFFIAFIIKIFSFFVKGKIFYYDTLMITIWSGTPMLVLLPLSIILIRFLIIFPGFIWLINLGMIGIWIWILLRVLRATSVVFDILPMRIYTIGLAIVASVYLILFSFYQYQFSIVSYLNYILKSINS